MTDLRNVLTASEASRKYRLTAHHIRYLAKRKLIRGRWAGGVWLIDEPSLRRYQAVERKPGPKPRRKSA